MARDFFINGESMVTIASAGSYPSGVQLGLTEDQVRVTVHEVHDDLRVEAWGKVPPELQNMGSTAEIHLRLIHYDFAVLYELQRLAMGGGAAVGEIGRAGTRMGANKLFSDLWIASPVASQVYHFFYTYLARNYTIPLGTEKSVVDCTFRAIPYTADPWGGGVGSLNALLWNNSAPPV